MVQKLSILLFVMLSFGLLANHPVLEGYIKSGLESNLALAQKEFSYQQSLKALKAARGMFLPSATIEARYSRAGGGRTIDFPVGDLINPIHETLNALLQQQAFPADLENVATPFLREEEQETKIRVVQPLFQPAIYHNYKAKKHLSVAQAAEKTAFKRQLVADIQRAYYNYLKTSQIKKLFVETEDLLTENLRVSKSLFTADKVTEDAVFRAKVELSKLQQQQAEADKNHALAAAYFNFLLNRDMDAKITGISTDSTAISPVMELSAAEKNALETREEFAQLRAAIAAAGSGVGANKAKFMPGVSLVFDYGIQGEEYDFGNDSDYWMASAVMRWNLFNGFQDQAAVQQAKIERKKLETQLAETEQQIRLQTREAYHNLLVGGKTLLAAKTQVNSARKSFQIIERKFREGIAPQIEFLDARNTLTSAEINKIIADYDYRIRIAEFEQIAALYEVK